MGTKLDGTGVCQQFLLVFTQWSPVGNLRRSEVTNGWAPQGVTCEELARVKAGLKRDCWQMLGMKKDFELPEEC